MTHVSVFYEISEGVYQVLRRDMDGKKIKINKKKSIIFRKDKKNPSRTFRRRTFWGLRPLIGDILNFFKYGYETVPIFRASYKSGEILGWETDEKIEISPELLQALSEEDSLRELASVKSGLEQMLIWFIMGGAMGAFFAYFVMTGGAESLMQFMG